MQSEIDPDFDVTPRHGRARRAIAFVAASLLCVTAAATAFLHPSLPAFMTSSLQVAPVVQAAYHVAVVDFVDPRTGWVVVLSEAGGHRGLHTPDTGRNMPPPPSWAGKKPL